MEIEKKTFERQPDFNTVAAFTIIDFNRSGYLDFECFKRYMTKFRKDIKRPEILGIIRRMDYSGDTKITFGEFSWGITPEYPGIEQDQMEFN